MRVRRRWVAIVGVMMAFALVVAACGDDDAADTTTTTAANRRLRRPAGRARFAVRGFNVS